MWFHSNFLGRIFWHITVNAFYWKWDTLQYPICKTQKVDVGIAVFRNPTWWNYNTKHSEKAVDGRGGHPFTQLWNKHLVTLCQGRVRFKTILWMSVSAFVCMESFLFSCAFWVSYVFGCVCLCEAIFQSYLSGELCSEYVSHTHFLSLHLRNSKKNLNQILLDCQ